VIRQRKNLAATRRLDQRVRLRAAVQQLHLRET
jgi:hypothetical protein